LIYNRAAMRFNVAGLLPTEQSVGLNEVRKGRDLQDIGDALARLAAEYGYTSKIEFHKNE
jgi:hypothetical protein